MTSNIEDNRKKWPNSDRFEPKSDYEKGGAYGQVQSFTWRSGQSVEVDRTPGGERIRIINADGSYKEMQHDGTYVDRVNGNSHEVVVKDKTVRVKGDVEVSVDGVMTVKSNGVEYETPYFRVNGSELSHNGVNVGDTHKHLGVIPGGGITDVPVGGSSAGSSSRSASSSSGGGGGGGGSGDTGDSTLPASSIVTDEIDGLESTDVQGALSEIKTEMDTSVSTLTLNIASLSSGKSDVGHEHDDRYYTEDEIDGLLAPLAVEGHSHSADDITSGTIAYARMPTAIPKATEVIAIDLNNITTPGWYPGLVIGTNTNGWGTSDYGYILVTEYAGAQLTQISYPYRGGKIRWRDRYTGSWSAWKTMLDSEGPHSISGGALTLTGVNGNMATGSAGTTSFEVRNSSGTGDGNMAMMTFHCASQFAVKMGLRADGYLGIGGYSAPTWRWYVNTATGDMTAAGNIAAYSDERLKTNIREIEDALAIVSQLRGVRFVKDGKENLGLIAQEVQKVLPELVTEGVDGYLTLNYQNLVGVLVESNKELARKNNDLEAKLDALMKRVEALEESI